MKWETDGFFSLIALFMSAEVPHILVKPTFGKHSELAGCPSPPMFVYRFSGDSWQQIPYAASPVRRVENNTTIDPKIDEQYIKGKNFKIPAGGVQVISHPSNQQHYGIDLHKFPTQEFLCPGQKKLNLQ